MFLCITAYRGRLSIVTNAGRDAVGATATVSESLSHTMHIRAVFRRESVQPHLFVAGLGQHVAVFRHLPRGTVM